jgi:hypothetical protein
VPLPEAPVPLPDAPGPIAEVSEPIVEEAEVSEPIVLLPEVLEEEESEEVVVESPLPQAVKAPIANTKNSFFIVFVLLFLQFEYLYSKYKKVTRS